VVITPSKERIMIEVMATRATRLTGGNIAVWVLRVYDIEFKELGDYITESGVMFTINNSAVPKFNTPGEAKRFIETKFSGKYKFVGIWENQKEPRKTF